MFLPEFLSTVSRESCSLYTNNNRFVKDAELPCRLQNLQLCVSVQ